MIVNMPSWNRNKTESLQLVALFNASVFSVNIEKCLQRTLTDIRFLETTSVEVDCGYHQNRVLGFCGDNSDSNFIGGFLSSFRTKLPCCRVCLNLCDGESFEIQ